MTMSSDRHGTIDTDSVLVPRARPRSLSGTATVVARVKRALRTASFGCLCFISPLLVRRVKPAGAVDEKA